MNSGAIQLSAMASTIAASAPMIMDFLKTGRYRGGPAKVAIVSSALMGTVSGSAMGNVVATGSFTIPLMKKTGQRPSNQAASHLNDRKQAQQRENNVHCGLT